MSHIFIIQLIKLVSDLLPDKCIRNSRYNLISCGTPENESQAHTAVKLQLCLPLTHVPTGARTHLRKQLTRAYHDQSETFKALLDRGRHL